MFLSSETGVSGNIWCQILFFWAPKSLQLVIASKYFISDSFVDYDGYSISSKGLLPTVLDIIVI